MDNLLFSNGVYSVQVIERNARHYILQRLKEKKGSVIVDTEDYPPEGYLIKIASPSEVFYFCLMTNNTGFPPQIIFHPNADYCWILYESSLVLFSIVEKKPVVRCSLSAMYWFAFYKNEHLIVIHELGVSCFDLTAKQIWTMWGSDKLNEYKVTDDQIICIFEDGKEKVHSI